MQSPTSAESEATLNGSLFQEISSKFGPEARTSIIPFVTVESILAVLSVTGNGLVLITYATQKKLRVPRNYYIVNVALADFFAGLVGIPVAIGMSFGWPRHFESCVSAMSANISIFNASIFAVVVIALDRLLAIGVPLFYKRNATSKFVLGMVTSSWVLGFAIGCVTLFVNQRKGFAVTNSCFFPLVIDFTYLIVLTFTTMALPLFLLISAYTYVFYVVHTVLNGTRDTGEVHQLSKKQAASMKEVRAAGKLGAIVAAFLVCWLPLQLINILAVLRVFTPSLKLIQIAIACSHANSALNPGLYAYFLNDFRNGMKNVVRMAFRCNNCEELKTITTSDGTRGTGSD